jgi:excinuclease ABC subunit C
MTFEISKITIPIHPGIYIMKDSDDKILYIGKAKNLKNRVRSYFLKNQNYKTQKLVEKIQDIEFVLTENEEEAFLLEANMIKRYRPPYNIELKDQQRYTYLRLTNERYPRITVARRTRNGEFLGGGRVYGPFTHGSSKMLSIGLLRKTFKIRICKKLPKEACLEYHLGNCEAPCQFKQAQENYGKNITELESILKGKQRLEDFVNKLYQDMKQASERRQYEKAKEIHETLQRLSSLQIKQNMETPRVGSDEEYFGIKINNQMAYLMSFRLANGVIKDRNKFSFDLVGDNSFSSFLSQYYSTNPIPKYVIVNEMPEKKELLEEVFSRISGFHVNIIVPLSGKRREIIDLIMKNISLTIFKGADPALIDLQERLELDTIPKKIECFDISNHGEDYAVGSMSCLVDGKPYKSGYRKFKIRTISGRDDFAMINEIVKRRYLRLKKDKSDMPDLILIDGGRGQLNAALDGLHSIGVKTACISLAKENEEVYHPRFTKPILMEKNNPALNILQHARDEAHRFGVAYNRAIRKFT